MRRKKSYKQRYKDKKKYYTKTDIFLTRMASILKVPNGVAHNLFNERTVTVIRLNSLIQSPEVTKAKLVKLGLQLEKVPWIDHTYIVVNLDKSDVGKLPEYFEGLFYIQNLSSMVPPLLLNPNPSDRVLDMCAAPGSKTTQLSDYMSNQGVLIANDVDPWRVKKLRDVLNLFNVQNAEVTNEDANLFGRLERESFDKVLLDAPCSGEGMIYLSAPMALRFWNVKKVKALTKVQQNLIESGFNALKRGGTMVYSTCTLEPDENEGIVSYLLDKYSRAKVVPVPLFNSTEFANYKNNVKRGLLKWNSRTYHKSMSDTYRILPSSRMMAFYIAIIQKA
ncbi:RsmB/NOP family class I SAM-dependent RNA methyltransferase [bacterium]|nr:RsmB/NOP family class I SAM-dependent RNA methyltransferase [bacterium]